MNNLKRHLFVIDAQVDFCDPSGNLFVTGADQDVKRLGAMLSRTISMWDAVHATLDSHQEVHIAHAICWVDSNGNHPKPFTCISEDDVENGKWVFSNPALRAKAREYVKALAKNGRYPLVIWPPHCIIATPGWSLHPDFALPLRDWARTRFKTVNFQVKGSNPMTEHYSVFKADVVDPNDASTMVNTGLIQTIQSADEIYIAGEALSHCVKNSIEDLIAEIGEAYAKKFVFLEDASSNVGTFEQQGADFVAKMKSIGMRFAKTTDL